MIRFDFVDNKNINLFRKQNGNKSHVFRGSFNGTLTDVARPQKKSKVICGVFKNLKKLINILKRPKNFSEEIKSAKKKGYLCQIKRTSKEISITLFWANGKPCQKTFYGKNRQPIRIDKFDINGEIVETTKFNYCKT